MVKADIKEIYETIKAMLGYALSLSESPIPKISRTIREFQRGDLISNLSNIIKDFNSTF